MVLDRYRDVFTALRDPGAAPVGGEVDAAAHQRMREQARELYSPAHLSTWTPQLSRLASDLASQLQGEVELVRSLAEPWSLHIASLVTGLDHHEAAQLNPAARAIFDAGASPTEEALQQAARDGAVRLASRFPASTAGLDVQAFVALTVSLPALLGNVMLALYEHPSQWDFTGAPGAIEELLRFCGPSLSQTRIRDGERLDLRLAEANRDPEQFAAPSELRLQREASGHLSFGGGSHACSGAPLVRAALGAFVPVFATCCRKARFVRSEPFGGPALRGHYVFVVL